jgi:CSLREA domain-containing protein
LPFITHATGLSTSRFRLLWPSTPSSTTVSGRVLDTSGNPITGGRTVKLIQNGAIFGTPATSDSVTGVYTFTGLTLNSGDEVATYISGGPEQGVTATVWGATDLTDFDIKASQLTIRSDNGGSIANTDLANEDSTKDPQIPFTVTGTALATTNGTSLQINTSSTYAPGGDVTVGGNWIDNGTFTPGGDTVTFNGTSLQTINKASGESFDNVTISGGAGTEVRQLSAVTINSQLNLSAADSLLTLNAQTLTLNGTETGTGNLKGDTSATLSVGGTSGGSLGVLRFLSGARSLSVLTMNRTGGISSVTFANDLLVNDTLNLNNGVVVMGVGLTLTANNVVNRSQGWVYGNLNRVFPCSTTCTIPFDVGTTNYSPVSEVFHVSGAGTYNQTVKASAGQYPSFDGVNVLQRYWTLSAPSPPVTSADITFKYVGGAPPTGDVVGNEGNYKVFEISGVTVTQPATQSISGGAHSATVTGVTSFSDWTLAEPASACVTPPSGLTHWYPADSNPNDVVGTSNGAFKNGVSLVTGKFGKAFEFNKTNAYVALPNNFFPYPTSGTDTTPFTFDVWFQTTTSGVIFGQQAGAPFNAQTLYEPGVYIGTDGKLHASLFNSGSQTTIDSPSIVTDNVFHNVAVTYDGTTETLYLDGVNVGSAAFTQTGYSTVYQYQFGTGYVADAWPANSGGWMNFSGLIDDVQIYNRALSGTDVQTIFNAPISGQCLTSAPISVTSISLADTNPTTASSVDFIVLFNTSVTGVDASDFLPVTTGSMYGAQVTNVSGAGATYRVTVSNYTGSGTLRLDLIDDDSITDGTTPLGGTGAGNGNFSAGDTYTITGADLTSFVVTTTADTDDGQCLPVPGPCSLRDAINAANFDAGAETITFNIPSADPGCNGGAGPCTVVVNNALPAISDSVTITGPNVGGPAANGVIVQRSTQTGTPAFRIFMFNSGVTATINELTISNGLINSGVTEGGGILNLGTLTITNSTISGNTSNSGGTDKGGGIYNGGTLTMINSTVAGNTAGGGGGDQGGGIFNLNNFTLSLINCTIANNTAVPDHGGGIFNAGNAAAVIARNTIIAGNTAGPEPDFKGPLTSQGHNVIGTTAGTTVTAQTGDQFNVSVSSLNFGALQNNGGPTPTIGLGFGSIAIDAGDDCVTSSTACSNPLLTTDQRGTGFPRLVGTHVDIGAVEFSPPELSLTKSDGGATVTPGGTVAYTLTYANNATLGATGVVLTETVPAHTTFNAGASTAGWSCAPDNNAGSTCTLTIGALAGTSGNQTATFAVTVDNLGLSGVTQISNTASIADDGTNGPDPIPGNNTGSDTTPVVCQTITVTDPANTSGQTGQAFSGLFTQLGANGTVTWSESGALPSGISLNTLTGVLSGTPTQTGTFPITVTATDANGCTGSNNYTLTISCAPITVNNPGSNSAPAGTALVAANFTFTQTGAVGSATFTTASTLPTGVSLTTGGVLTGTPTQTGSFPITVTVTDGNGCPATSSGYTLTVTCQTITVTNPSTSTGTAGTAFSQQFSQSGGIGTITFSETGSLPTGFSFNTSTGVLSGTTHQVGTFPITVTATDQNGCQGTGLTYNLTISCQTITVTNPGVNTGTVDAAFSQTFTVSGILDTVTWSETGALPAGITLDPSTGVLSGTPTVTGSFPITVKATDTNGCFSTSSYTLTINCQTITVTDPATNTGTVAAAFSQIFTQTGAHGTATFTTASTLPTGLSLSSGGVLSGTPTQPGTFPIVVTVTDSNGCTGSGTTYNLTINCQTITVTNPSTNHGTVNASFSQTFIQSGAQGTATFTTASTLPNGLSLATNGVLSGTPTQLGSFPIVVTVTDSNGCTGSGTTYNLTIGCQTITVTNPANSTAHIGQAFSELFNQTGGNGTVTWSETGALPLGISLNTSTGELSGTPTQSGSFPITVTATDGNGCSGGNAYTLVVKDCIDPPSGLVSWYPADNNAADIVGPNNGTLLGGITFAPGKFGQSFNFDGIDDGVSFGNTVANFGTSDFTVDFWVKTISTRNEEILNNRYNASNGSFLSIRLLSTGKVNAEIDGDTSGTGYIPLNSVASINDGAFHHLAVVRQGTSAFLYIDGVLDQSGSASVIANINSGAFRAGFASFNIARFTGNLDEIEIFNRALAPSEVQDIYNAPGGKCRAPTPMATSITRLDANPSAAASVDFSVVFSTSVTGVDATDFLPVMTGVLSGAQVTNVTGSGTTYTVTVTNYTGGGTLRLDLIDDDSISDGNTPLGGTGISNGDFNAGEIYTIIGPNPPVASNISKGVPINTLRTITLSATDPDGDALTFTVPVDLPQHGTLSNPGTPVCSAGTCTQTIDYTPTTGYTGPDSFTYTATDGAHESNLATVSINVIVCPSTFTITSLGETSDANQGDGVCDDGTGQCTLRAAIEEANADAGCATITIDATAVTPGTITLTTALPDIIQNVIINGPGANLFNVQRATSGSPPAFRIFTIDAGITVAINGLTISNGLVSTSNADLGGGIFNDGNLTLTAVTISGNQLGGAGQDKGAGIYNDAGATLVMNACEVSGNSNNGSAQDQGGGLFNAGTASIYNTTISGNVAGGAGNDQGGGIWNSATLTLINDTIANNSASNGTTGGGGIHQRGTCSMRNTIVAGNTALQGPDINGAIQSKGHNLIGDGTLMTGATDGVNFDQVGTTASPKNPLLGPLQNNGGPTQTMALNFGSTAIDAGDDCVFTDSCSPVVGFALTTDQRGTGFSRQTDGDSNGTAVVDIGAFEAPACTTPPASNGGPYCEGATISLSTPTITGATYSWTGPNGFTSTLQNPTLTAAIAAAGTYSVTVTVNGCTSAAGTTDVVVNPIPATPVASNGGPYCEGATISLSTPTVSGATYSWTGPNGFTSAAQNPTITGATTANAGTYSVTVTANGCTSAAGTTDVVINAIPATPTASNSGPYCEGATIQLSTPTVSGATYSWTGPNGFTSALQNPTLSATIAAAGTYSVTVTVNGCTSPAGTTNVIVFSPTATFTLNDTGDTDDAVPGDGVCDDGAAHCTLRAAISEANAEPACRAITIDATGVSGQITLTSALPAIDANVNVTGAGLIVSGNNNSRVFSINSGRTVTISGLTITAGKDSAQGGGILNAGALTLTDVTVSGNSAGGIGSGQGGGIYCNAGTLVITNSTLSGNQATGGTDDEGGAIYNNNGTVSLTNVTIASNTVSGGSVSNQGGGIFTSGGTVNLRNTIVAGNTASVGPDLSGSFTSQGHNFIGKGDDSTGLSNGVSNDQVGSVASPIDPLLGPLANNGGPTQTMALLTGSTAIDAGDDCVFTDSCSPAVGVALTTDQRGTGFSRQTDGDSNGTAVVDIGAFEAPACITPPATPTASNGGPYCEGATIQLSTPAVSGAIYSWTGPNGFTSAQQNPTLAASIAAAGTYSVTVTVGGCASAAGTTDVVVNSTATPAASNGGPYCEGATISLSTPAVGGASYLWTGPSGFTSTQQSPTLAATIAAAGTYFVSVTVNGCPSASGSTNVIVNPIPATPAASNGGPYCEGATISLSTPTVSGATYSWTGPNGFTSTQQNPTLTAAVANAGTYSVTVTVNGCTSAAGATNVVVNPIPATPTASNGGPYCEGSTISLSTPAVSGATYSWTGPNGFTSTQQNPTLTAAVANAGTYSVTVTVNGCTSAAGATNVVVNPIPATPTASNGGPYCEGSTISLSTPAVSGATYSWTGPNGFTSTQQNPTLTAAIADAGTYSVTVTVNSCTSAAGSTNVVVNPIPATPVAGNGGPYCEGGTISLSTPTVSGATYSWTGPNGFTSTQQNPTLAAATAAAGTYSVTVTVNGCTSAAGNTNVIVNPIPATPAAGNSGPYCEGATIQLSTPTVSGATYSWTGPNGFTSANQNPTLANATTVNGGTYSVTVTVNGCASAAGSTNVVINTIPAAPSASNTGPYLVGQTIQLNASTVAGATYSWTGPNGFTSALQNPTKASATVADAGDYSVTVTVAGCASAPATTNVQVACATSFTVNDSGDAHDANPGDGVCATVGAVCTLRAAIEEANALTTCGTININFNAGVSSITAGSELTVTHNLTIDGSSANALTINGNGATRLFTVNNGATLSLSSLTITGGNGAGGDGGAVQNNGTLTLNGVTLNANNAVNGGAIRNDGTVTLINTTMSGNTATGNGGGFYNAAGSATLICVTVAYDRSDSDSNGSGSGGGVFVAGGNVLLRNTIVSDNYKGGSPSTTADNIGGGTVDSTSSYDLIGTGDTSGLVNGTNNNQVGVASAYLGQLINNGGNTLTVGLTFRSPAIDTGDPTIVNAPLSVTTDQRGLTRPADGDSDGTTGVDIGAYEHQATESRSVSDGTNVFVDINDVRLTFPAISGAAQDSVQLTINPIPPDAPPGTRHTFDVHPTSTFFTPPVSLCIYLPFVTDAPTFSTFTMWHRENGVFVQHTAQIDFPNKTICINDITSFSQFVVDQAVTPTVANGSVAGQIIDTNGNPIEGTAVRMNGTQSRLTITDAAGNYRFDNVETNGLYVITPSRANFNFSPNQKTFSQLGARTEAAFTGRANNTGLNPLDTTEYFVRQQYLDFLGREPDESGFNFWVNNIESCGADVGCIEAKRVDTSAAFFLSIEFQQTGYLVYRTYEAAYGNLDGAPVPLMLRDFNADAPFISNGLVVLQSGWQQKLENNKRAFMSDFVLRSPFTTAYPTSLTPAQFVDRLFAKAQLDSSDPDYAASIAEFQTANDTSDLAARARVLRRIAENGTLTQREFNQAFVLMEYFGYLRRDPNAGRDTDFSGYSFWLTKLDQFNGNFEAAEMVKAFLASTEYRGRFPR